ncbi:MAG TPA: FAD/NAD(P)-binding oxidoreductase [Kouleothrix sp.]|uniref:NAD(P)/FAD-dependent oxidoreductase n=1 Tax=Kouleothrix sp. TaxID=2779161 RepID=UPI002CE1A527|nr:FAD/NAD(P)-binding oxidoreductase [Kouleothrix sp.]HRC75462.1 FAD/NAD(P)-binding oxidoreductase [Kouleothrix sp.]
MPFQEIVVLGGGVGGTLIANLLARKLTRAQARITLIDRTGRHAYQPGFLYIPFGGEPPEQLERDERRLLSRRVTLVVGDVAQIDREARVIAMADGVRFPYDTLVIATGSHLAPERLPGFAEGAHHFYKAAAALRLHAALRDFSGGRIVVGVADLPYKCPPAPLEFAFLLDDHLRERGVREHTEIVYFSPIDRVCAIDSVDSVVAPLLAERGIHTELQFQAAAIDPQARTLTSHDGASLPYDLLVMVPPHRGAPIVVEAGLGNEFGWIPTDPETLQSKADPNIYVIGDASDLPVSKSGSAAHFEAKVLAQRIVAAALGQPDDTRYSGEVMCFIETGRGQASQLVFDYTHPPQPPQPNQLFHYEKTLFNKLYWYLVPRGMV